MIVLIAVLIGCVSDNLGPTETDAGVVYIRGNHSCPTICEIQHIHFAKHEELCEEPCTQITYRNKINGI